MTYFITDKSKDKLIERECKELYDDLVRNGIHWKTAKFKADELKKKLSEEI